MRRVMPWVALCAVLAGCNPKGPAAMPSSTPNPRATPTGLSIKITQNGSSQARLRFIMQKGNTRDYELVATADHSVGSPGSEHVEFSNPDVTFYAKDGTTLQARAPHAVADQTANVVVLDGGVHGRSSNGTTLQCDTLTYDRRTQMLHGVGHVLITNRSGFRASGTRFDSNISLTRTTMR